MEGTAEVSSGRLLAFRIVATLVGALTVVFTLPFAVTTWFDEGSEAVHHIHLVAGVGFGLLLGASLLLVAWRPQQHVSLFQGAIAMTVASLAFGLLSGDFIGGLYFVSAVVAVVLIWLHPARRQVFGAGKPSWAIAVFPLLGLIPALAYALTQAELQRNGVAADPHVDMHHYSGMAVTTVGIMLAGLVAAARIPGHRLTAWLAALSLALIGAASLVWPPPDFQSAFETVWAWAAIVGSVAFVLVTEGLGASRGRGA